VSFFTQIWLHVIEKIKEIIRKSPFSGIQNKNVTLKSKKLDCYDNSKNLFQFVIYSQKAIILKVSWKN